MMPFAWDDAHAPLNKADDRELDRNRDKRTKHPRFLRALATDGRTLTDQPQQHYDATGTLGPPVLDVEESRQDYARAMAAQQQRTLAALKALQSHAPLDITLEEAKRINEG